VEAIAEGKSRFADVATWFAGRGMQDKIDQLLRDTRAKADAKMDQVIQNSYDQMMQRLEEMRNR
jgi:hypothetical protein